MAHLLVLLFDVFVLGGICFMGAIILLWRYRTQRSGRRSPLTRRLLRSPGESLRSRIEEVQWDIATFFALGTLPMPLVLGLYFATWVAAGGPPSLMVASFFATTALLAQLWLGWKLWKCLAFLRRLRLGHEAELAVGQELSELGGAGYRMFHDFPAGSGFNIDHIVVGPGGVYLIETKGRSKPGPQATAEAPWEVKYDGKVLQFPGWIETKPLAQARRNAEWLEKWLSSAVGQPLPVQPVVALPGWFVRRSNAHSIPVLAVGEIQGYFSSRPKQPEMTAQLVRQIVHQLDQKCRDVAPRAHGQARPASEMAPVGS
ncbi:MAG TPA: nuclease-related domain-containing protein [Burkholderiales bacterium]